MAHRVGVDHRVEGTLSSELQMSIQKYIQFEFQGIFAKYHLLEALYFGSVPKISARLSVFWNVLIPVKGVTHLSVTANIGVQGRIS